MYTIYEVSLAILTHLKCQGHEIQDGRRRSLSRKRLAVEQNGAYFRAPGHIYYIQFISGHFDRFEISRSRNPRWPPNVAISETAGRRAKRSLFSTPWGISTQCRNHLWPFRPIRKFKVTKSKMAAECRYLRKGWP